MILLLLTENDMLCGFGALSDPNSQSVYKGEFRDDMRHGAGVFTYPTGEYNGI